MQGLLLSAFLLLAVFYSLAFQSCQSSSRKAKITGYLSNIGLQYIIVLDFTFALLALITAIIVFIRYYRVFIIPENDVRFGERNLSTPVKHN